MKLFKKAEGGGEDSDEGVQDQAGGEGDHDQSLSESAEPGWWGVRGVVTLQMLEEAKKTPDVWPDSRDQHWYDGHLLHGGEVGAGDVQGDWEEVIQEECVGGVVSLIQHQSYYNYMVLEQVPKYLHWCYLILLGVLPLCQALMDSCAVPGHFSPVIISGSTHVDVAIERTTPSSWPSWGPSSSCLSKGCKAVLVEA